MSKLTIFVLTLSYILVNVQCSYMKIPSFANEGDSVSIECSIDLGRLLCVSISFFKDNKEIYRWSRAPDGGNPSSYFPMAGVSFNLERQDRPNEVELISVETQTSGNYTCKASINHPLMSYVELSGTLSVYQRSKS